MIHSSDGLNKDSVVYKNNNDLRNIVSHEASIEWKHSLINIPGTKSYSGHYSFHYRDPMEVCRRLFGRTDLEVTVKAKSVYKNGERFWNELSSADWWEETQRNIDNYKKDTDGTVIAIMLGSDATILSQHSGNKKAHPIYLQLGNHSNEKRATYSKNAIELLRFLP